MKSSSSDERRRVVMVGGVGAGVGEAVVAAGARRGFEVEGLVSGGLRRGEWGEMIEGATAVVNLEGIAWDCRVDGGGMHGVRQSRIDLVRAIGDAMHSCRRAPGVWVQAGTMAIYGPAGERWCDEGAPVGQSAVAIEANEVEAAFAQSPTPRTRRVLLRTAAVLGRAEPPPGCFFCPRNFFSRLADDPRFFSWIHVDDLVRVILRAIEDQSMSGVYNATGPDPIPWACFVRERRRVLRQGKLRVPDWPGRLGGWRALFARPAVLTGVRGDPRRLEEAGFTFRFPSLSEALCDLFPARDRVLARRVTNPSPMLSGTGR
jgi:uncharacterized protein